MTVPGEIAKRAIRDIDRLVCADGPYGWEARPDGTDIILRAIDEATADLRQQLAKAPDATIFAVMKSTCDSLRQQLGGMKDALFVSRGALAQECDANSKLRQQLRATGLCEAHMPAADEAPRGCPACEAVHQADLVKSSRAKALRDAADWFQGQDIKGVAAWKVRYHLNRMADAAKKEAPHG